MTELVGAGPLAGILVVVVAWLNARRVHKLLAALCARVENIEKILGARFSGNND